VPHKQSEGVEGAVMGRKFIQNVNDTSHEEQLFDNVN